MQNRSALKQLWYDFLHVTCRVASVALFRVRVTGREHVPLSGGLLVCANHQSHLDPVLVGLSLDRRLNYLARENLFDILPLRWLIQSLNAVPIDRDGLGLAGLRETLRRLKRREAVLIFPEGTRTHDGEVAPLKPGFVALARRGRVPLLPVAVDGSFDAWPRTRSLPWPAVVHIVIGPPVAPAEFAQMDDAQLVGELDRRIRACHAQARRGRRRAGDARRAATVGRPGRAGTPARHARRPSFSRNRRALGS